MCSGTRLMLLPAHLTFLWYCLETCAAPSTCRLDVEFEVDKPLTLSVRACMAGALLLDAADGCVPLEPGLRRRLASAKGDPLTSRMLRICSTSAIAAGLPNGAVQCLAQRLQQRHGAARWPAERRECTVRLG